MFPNIDEKVMVPILPAASSPACTHWILSILLSGCLSLQAVAAEAPPEDRPVDPDGTGSIFGVVRYEGEVPKARFADDTGRRRDLLEVDRKTKGLRYVAAFLVLKEPKESSPSKTPKSLPPVVINQEEHTFVPHLVTVLAGQTVKFTNSDPANHNVRGNSLEVKNQFNVFTGNGNSYEHCFRTDRKDRPVVVSCDIHPWMRAWVYVFEHPFHGVTDNRGRFRISAVPPGKYRLVLEQPDGGYKLEREVNVVAGKAVPLKVTVRREDLKRIGR